jgi:hypothetical protein
MNANSKEEISPSAPRGRKWRLRVLHASCYAACTLLFFYVVSFFAMTVYAFHLKAETEKEWAALNLPLADILKAFPRKDKSHAAKELESLAMKLGVCIIPQDEISGSDYSEEMRKKEILKPVYEYFSAEVASPNSAIALPPPSVSNYMRDYSGPLDAIAAFLNRGEPIVWHQDVSRLVSDPIPNLLGHVDLQKLLLSAALVSFRENRREQAVQFLDASWQMNASIQGRPDEISTLIALCMTRLEMAVLRKIGDAPVLWESRLGSLHYREVLVQSLRHSAWCKEMSLLCEDPAEELRADLCACASDHIGALLLKGPWAWPQRRIVSYEVSRAYAWAAAETIRRDICSNADMAPSANLHDRVSWLVPQFSAHEGEDLSSIFKRLARFDLHRELTLKILEAKQARTKNRGRWPSEIPGIEKSACPSYSWNYKVSSKGDMTIRLSKELTSDKADIPYSYHSH